MKNLVISGLIRVYTSHSNFFYKNRYKLKDKLTRLSRYFNLFFHNWAKFPHLVTLAEIYSEEFHRVNKKLALKQSSGNFNLHNKQIKKLENHWKNILSLSLESDKEGLQPTQEQFLRVRLQLQLAQLFSSTKIGNLDPVKEKNRTEALLVGLKQQIVQSLAEYQSEAEIEKSQTLELFWLSCGTIHLEDFFEEQIEKARLKASLRVAPAKQEIRVAEKVAEVIEHLSKKRKSNEMLQLAENCSSELLNYFSKVPKTQEDQAQFLQHFSRLILVFTQNLSQETRSSGADLLSSFTQLFIALKLDKIVIRADIALSERGWLIKQQQRGLAPLLLALLYKLWAIGVFIIFSIDPNSLPLCSIFNLSLKLSEKMLSMENFFRLHRIFHMMFHKESKESPKFHKICYTAEARALIGTQMSKMMQAGASGGLAFYELEYDFNNLIKCFYGITTGVFKLDGDQEDLEKEEEIFLPYYGAATSGSEMRYQGRFRVVESQIFGFFLDYLFFSNLEKELADFIRERIEKISGRPGPSRTLSDRSYFQLNIPSRMKPSVYKFGSESCSQMKQKQDTWLGCVTLQKLLKPPVVLEYRDSLVELLDNSFTKKALEELENSEEREMKEEIENFESYLGSGIGSKEIVDKKMLEEIMRENRESNRNFSNKEESEYLKCLEKATGVDLKEISEQEAEILVQDVINGDESDLRDFLTTYGYKIEKERLKKFFVILSQQRNNNNSCFCFSENCGKLAGNPDLAKPSVGWIFGLWIDLIQNEFGKFSLEDFWSELSQPSDNFCEKLQFSIDICRKGFLIGFMKKSPLWGFYGFVVLCRLFQHQQLISILSLDKIFYNNDSREIATKFFTYNKSQIEILFFIKFVLSEFLPEHIHSSGLNGNEENKNFMVLKENKFLDYSLGKNIENLSKEEIVEMNDNKIVLERIVFGNLIEEAALMLFNKVTSAQTTLAGAQMFEDQFSINKIFRTRILKLQNKIEEFAKFNKETEIVSDNKKKIKKNLQKESKEEKTNLIEIDPKNKMNEETQPKIQNSSNNLKEEKKDKKTNQNEIEEGLFYLGSPFKKSIEKENFHLSKLKQTTLKDLQFSKEFHNFLMKRSRPSNLVSDYLLVKTELRLNKLELKKSRVENLVLRLEAASNADSGDLIKLVYLGGFKQNQSFSNIELELLRTNFFFDKIYKALLALGGIISHLKLQNLILSTNPFEEIKKIDGEKVEESLRALEQIEAVILVLSPLVKQDPPLHDKLAKFSKTNSNIFIFDNLKLKFCCLNSQELKDAEKLLTSLNSDKKNEEKKSSGPKTRKRGRSKNSQQKLLRKINLCLERSHKGVESLLIFCYHLIETCRQRQTELGLYLNKCVILLNKFLPKFYLPTGNPIFTEEAQKKENL